MYDNDKGLNNKSRRGHLTSIAGLSAPRLLSRCTFTPLAVPRPGLMQATATEGPVVLSNCGNSVFMRKAKQVFLLPRQDMLQVSP